MSIYQRFERPRADSDFEPGALQHIAAGKRGRLLDARRTPVQVIAVDSLTGTFSVRIEAFEDKGAIWESEFENAGHYQFEPGEPVASAEEISRFEQAIAKFDRRHTIERNDTSLAATRARIRSTCDEARPWLVANAHCFKSTLELPDPEQRTGMPELWTDLEAYLRSQGLWDIEGAFARQFVSNPYSGNLVKGHRMVMAEMGLASFEGKIVRHSDVFSGAWTRERREAHIIARLAFVREVFARLGRSHLTLYRGLSTNGPLKRGSGDTLISSTLSHDVATSHFRSLDDANTRALYAQAVPIERIFMTYLETRPMNEQFKEAEVILFSDERNLAF